MLNCQTFKLFKTDGSTADDFPLYTMKDGELFRTIAHPLGWSENPDYVFGNDGKFYRTKYHPQGLAELPDYEFRGDKKLYRTNNHPSGFGDNPDYLISD